MMSKPSVYRLIVQGVTLYCVAHSYEDAERMWISCDPKPAWFDKLRDDEIESIIRLKGELLNQYQSGK